MNREEVTKKIEEYERLIEITKKTRDDAIAAKITSQTKLDASLEVLQKHGVTPETAESELYKIDAEIESLLKELRDSIPVEILTELGRLK